MHTSGASVAQAWMDTAKQRVRRYHGEATGLSDMDDAAMLTALIAILLAWLISEMLDL